MAHPLIPQEHRGQEERQLRFPYRVAATAFLLLLVVTVPSVFARRSDGPISGIVQDGKGGAIAGAEVTLENAAGQAVASRTTDAEGAFSFDSANAGRHVIRVNMVQFAPLNFELAEEAERTHLRLVLTIAVQSQSVNVTAEGGGIELRCPPCNRMTSASVVSGPNLNLGRD